MVIDIAKSYSAKITTAELTDPRLTIHNVDGKRLLNSKQQKFDAIIINLPAPSTLQLNRFYTQEFFRLLKQSISSRGVICLKLPGSLSYLSDEQVDLNKSILKTLKTVFQSIEIIPGNYNLYIAGNFKTANLTTNNIIKTLEKNNIQLPLFNKYYLADRLSADRKQWFLDSLLLRKVKMNKDLEPVGVFYSLSLWNSLFSPAFQNIFSQTSQWTLFHAISILLIFTLLLFGIITLIKKMENTSNLSQQLIPFMVFSSGFTGISLSLIFLLSLQTFYGYVYLYIGLLLSAYMVGLTLGGWLMTSQLEKRKKSMLTLLKIDTSFFLFSGLSAFLLFNMQSPYIAPGLIIFILAIMSAITGFLTGFEFPLANKIHLENKKNPSNILYAVDMGGSFCGAILTSVLLIPILGIIQTIIFIAVLKVCLISLLFLSYRQPITILRN